MQTYLNYAQLTMYRISKSKYLYPIIVSIRCPKMMFMVEKSEDSYKSKLY